MAADGCSHTEVAEHRIGLPVAHELDGFAVDSRCLGSESPGSVPTGFYVNWWILVSDRNMLSIFVCGSVSVLGNG